MIGKEGTPVDGKDKDFFGLREEKTTGRVVDDRERRDPCGWAG